MGRAEKCLRTSDIIHDVKLLYGIVIIGTIQQVYGRQANRTKFSTFGRMAAVDDTHLQLYTKDLVQGERVVVCKKKFSKMRILENSLQKYGIVWCCGRGSLDTARWNPLPIWSPILQNNNNFKHNVRVLPEIIGASLPWQKYRVSIIQFQMLNLLVLDWSILHLSNTNI